MDFSKVKTLTIPEGSVSKITISNKIVWQKADANPYTELPYLVATDASYAWIDLGIPYQDGCKVECKITYKNNTNMFGVFYTAKRMRLQATNNALVFNAGISASDSLFPTITDLITDGIYTITCEVNPDISKIGLAVDDRQSTTSMDVDWITWDSTPHNIYLFAVNRPSSSGIAYGTRVIHYFKYWDVNNNLILDLIPVQRNSDGALGMLNKINNQFLTNISTGTFYKDIPANISDYVDDIDII